VDIGTAIAYKEGDRPRRQFETRRKIMASKKVTKKLKKGTKIQPTKTTTTTTIGSGCQGAGAGKAKYGTFSF
jgi:hypothetical protein